MDTRTFTSADDETIITLIKNAKNRLAVISPGITEPVALALAERLNDLDTLIITVILDADAEVYRMGYGDQEALEIIRTASKDAMFDLREQSGLRIGIVISDENTLIYAPTCRNIEAGSTSEDKPNAILLPAIATKILAEATGVTHGAAEVGLTGMKPERVEEMQADLRASPPDPVDLTRKLKVFRSAVQYVDLKVSNCQFNNKQVKLPKMFLNVTDTELKKRISSRIRSPLNVLDEFEITIKVEGKCENLTVNQAFINNERKEIEEAFTYVLKKKGRIILKRDRDNFDAQIKRFEMIISAYQDKLSNNLESTRANFTKQMLKEFTEKWLTNPPPHFSRRFDMLTEEVVNKDITWRAHQIFDETMTFNPPDINLNYKDIIIEDLENEDFMLELHDVMQKAYVEENILNKLFESGGAAPVQGQFQGLDY